MIKFKAAVGATSSNINDFLDGGWRRWRRLGAGVGRQAMQKQGQARIKKREKMARKKGGGGVWGGRSRSSEVAFRD